MERRRPSAFTGMPRALASFGVKSVSRETQLAKAMASALSEKRAALSEATIPNCIASGVSR